MASHLLLTMFPTSDSRAAETLHKAFPKLWPQWMSYTKTKRMSYQSICGGNSRYYRVANGDAVNPQRHHEDRIKLIDALGKNLCDEGSWDGQKWTKFSIDDFLKGPPFTPPSPREIVAGEEFSEGALPLGLFARHLSGYLKQLGTNLSEAQKENRVIERQLLDHLASSYETLQIWEEAVSYLRRLVEVNRWFEDPIYLTRASLRLGVAQYRIGEYLIAACTLRKAISLLRWSGKVPRGAALKTEAQLYDFWALACLRSGRAKLALTILKRRCQPLHDQCPTPLDTAAFEVRLGLAYMALEELLLAKPHLLESLEIRWRFNARSEAAHALHNLGLLHYRQNDMPQALLIFLFCLKWQEKLHDLNGQAKTHFYRARIFHQLYDAQKSAGAASIIGPFHPALTEEFFPDARELEILSKVGEIFMDDLGRPYRPDQHLPTARFHYETCLMMTSRSRSGSTLIEQAQRGLAGLPRRTSLRRPKSPSLDSCT
jgi:tetratricopeptide (TPR) repeat protein